jgi:malto-oligosyltrehalose trehalohydrolase
VRLGVWAPFASAVEVDLGTGREPLRPADDGWWSADLPGLGHGDAYGFRLDGGDPLPDPRAVWLPEGVHGLACAYDHGRFGWTDRGWPGRPLAGSVVYELHVGTFTPEGTLDAAVDRLDHLAELGVDLVELMPLASFDGRHGWGYDGVALWAVHEPYGGPDALKRFVDACHRRGLGVLLDVVYNHLGPSGNHLARFGPYFTDAHRTPWGDAVNLDQPGSDGTRAFLLDNAESWLRDFHLDGLRLDAVHELSDERALTLLEELATRVDALVGELGRPLSLVAETDRNDPRVVLPRTEHGLGLAAQWDDDVHHAVHAAVTGERQGYYADFGSLAGVAKTLTGAFFHDGTWSSFRGRHHGRPVDRAVVPGHRFVVALQTHDQVGNRAAGDRISAALSPGLLRVAVALVLTSPFTPMLFMGEEWAASSPFAFFSSFPDPGLGRAVTEGRRREFRAHGWSDTVPDPQDPATFEASVLDWAEPAREPHASVLGWYRALLALRRTESDLRDAWLDRVTVAFDEAERWLVVTRGRLRVAANLSAQRRAVPLGSTPADVLLASSPPRLLAAAVELAPESVAVVRVSG